MTTSATVVTVADLSRATQQAVEAGKVQIDLKKDVNCFRPYNSQLGAVELEGYRNALIIYRTSKATGKKEGETSFIRVRDHITEELVKENLTSLAPYFISFLHKQEDNMLKELHKSGAKTINSEDIGIDKLLAYMETSAESQRISGEKIEAWFVQYMKEPLMLAFAAKQGIDGDMTDAQFKKLETICAVYNKKFQGLASGKVSYSKEEAQALLKALEVTETDTTVMGARFVTRLQDMVNKKDEDWTDALGL